MSLGNYCRLFQEKCISRKGRQAGAKTMHRKGGKGSSIPSARVRQLMEVPLIYQHQAREVSRKLLQALPTLRACI